MKDPGVDEAPDGKGKKPVQGNGGKGPQQNNGGNGGKRKSPDGGSELVANANTGPRYQKGNNGGKNFKPKSFEELLKGPCPKHGSKEKPTTHSWEDCRIMRAYGERFQNHQGDPGARAGGSSGGYPPQGFQRPGGSGGGYQGNSGSSGGGYQGNNSGGNQQQNNQTGYQSNPKQLSSVQYHVFTTYTDKRDRKLKRRPVNLVEPAVS